MCSFLVGFIGFLILAMYLWKKNPHFVQYKSGRKIYKSALLCGLSSSFFLSIVLCTLIPTLITVENDLNYKEDLSLFSNGEFIGIGGSYIANNSNKTLRLVGIDEDKDINVIITPGNIKKVRKCPEVYFEKVPEHRSKRYRKTNRGRLKAVYGPSVFLVEY